MFTIGKTFRFAAAHRLETLPPSHKCHRTHGHNYDVTITLEKDYLDEHDVLDFEPTAENLAWWIYNQAIALPVPVTGVMVCETPNTFAEYHPDDH
jgi:6-pyruvoyltetrahydropterin/6-carboxytetrahydropterin synthase